MNNIHEHIDLIERYLYDDMTKEELEEFNTKLRKDKAFNKLFYEMDNLLEGIRHSAKQSTVDEKLATLETALPIKEKADEFEDDTPIIPIWSSASRLRTAFTTAFTTAVDYKYRTGIAAAFALLIVASIVLFNVMNNGSTNTLFSEYFVPFENQGSYVLRGADEKNESSEKQLLRKALLAYDNGNYAEAAAMFDEMPINGNYRIEVWMYGGNAYLQEGQVDKAKEMFQNIIDEDVGFVIQAKWYLSLCYVKEGQFEDARPLLEEIRDSDSRINKDAEKILSKL